MAPPAPVDVEELEPPEELDTLDVTELVVAREDELAPPAPLDDAPALVLFALDVQAIATGTIDATPIARRIRVARAR